MIGLAFLLGVVAGMRTMTPIAAVSITAANGMLPLGGSWLAFLGAPIAPWITVALAIGEYVTDALPITPSRTVAVQFGGRIVSGALCGAAVGIPSGSVVPGAVAGAVGAVVGTLGGAAARGRLASAFGRDLPAAITEDAVAIALAAAVVLAL